MILRTETTSPGNYVTAKQLVQRHPFLTLGGVRHALFFRHENGLAIHVINVGRRIAINEDGFIDWLRTRGDAPISGASVGDEK